MKNPSYETAAMIIRIHLARPDACSACLIHPMCFFLVCLETNQVAETRKDNVCQKGVTRRRTTARRTTARRRGARRMGARRMGGRKRGVSRRAPVKPIFQVLDLFSKVFSDGAYTLHIIKLFFYFHLQEIYEFLQQKLTRELWLCLCEISVFQVISQWLYQNL